MKESGSCPKCNTRIEDYGVLEVQDGCVYYPFTCDKCGFEGREWYNLDFTGFTDEDGNEITDEMIRAEVHSDDHKIEVNFDASMYFVKVSDKDLQELEDCEWGGDYPADKVAQYFEENMEIAQLLKYCRDNNIGFECHINKEDAMAWIKKNRPMYRRIEEKNA